MAQISYVETCKIVQGWKIRVIPFAHFKAIAKPQML